MKIAIVGTRSFNNYEMLEKILAPYVDTCTEEICGEARGADTLGKRWATENSIPVKSFKAEWGKYGAGAGPRRNAEMAVAADLVVAFYDGSSRGTTNMLDNAFKQGKKTIVVHYLENYYFKDGVKYDC